MSKYVRYVKLNVHTARAREKRRGTEKVKREQLNKTREKMAALLPFFPGRPLSEMTAAVMFTETKS